jgi:hypothetical protein
MGSGELQRLAKSEGEAKSVHEAEPKRNHPSPLNFRYSNNVFKRHINDGSRDQCFDQRWKPERIRREVISGRDQRNRVRHRERGDHGNECTKSPERNYQTKKKQQVIGSIQNVKESQLDEPQSRLSPTRVKSNEARITDELKRAHRATGWLKPKNDDHPFAEAAKSGMNRKAGLVRVNRIVE